MSPINRRRLLLLAGGGALTLGALRLGIPRWLRVGRVGELGEGAAAFAERCFAGVDRSRLWDSHVHLVGLGTGDTGCSVDPQMLSHWHPVKRFQFEAYAAAAGMSDEHTADADYLERLLRLHRAANPQGKLVLLALDRVVDEAGQERPERTAFHTPDDYALRVAREHPDVVAAASIHPYRADAVERLDRAADAGAVAVKWIPNAQAIDPAAPRCDAFYRRLVERDVPLICHAGKEYAVESGHQHLGNPQRLRRALDHGVRVIVAHCAALGSFEDLDQPEGRREKLPSFELFFRLFRDSRYASNLFADVSTLTHVHHAIEPLLEMLRAPELHDRLIYGSDYPLPAIRVMISTLRLKRHGLLTAEERGWCNEIYEANPLLFDFVVTRSLRLRTSSGEYGFAPRVFDTARVFDRVNRPGAERNGSA